MKLNYFQHIKRTDLIIVCVMMLCPATCTFADESPGYKREPIMSKYVRSCGICHSLGLGMSPRLGATEDWKPRLAQGSDLLLQHTIEGFNNMPPLGQCMDCSSEDLQELIGIMAGVSTVE